MSNEWIDLFFKVTGIGILVSVLWASASSYFRSVKRQRQPTTGTASTEQRIKRLTTLLLEANRLIGEIEKEVTSRTELASKLKADIEYYERIVALKQPEVEAVAQVLQGIVQKEERRSFWKSVGLNFMFFLLGVIITLIIS